mmetsp:Transcript_22560/g.63332  ORF Transcript_22560/g.63332 Transcript_22560/m.63332 type:complete len:392 (-) Transcript_22560:1377-2552(-)
MLLVGLEALARRIPSAQPDALVHELGHLGVVAVVLAAGPRLQEAEELEGLELLPGEGLGPEGLVLGRDLVQGEPAHAAHRALEGRADDLVAQAVRLEDLGTLVAREQGDAHLGQDLHQALVESAAEVVLAVLQGEVRHLPTLDHVLRLGRGAPLAHRLEAQVRAHGRRPVAHQHGHVVGAEALRGLRDERRVGADGLVDQVVVHRARGQQRRDERPSGVEGALGPVAEHHDLAAGPDGGLHVGAQLLQRRGEPAVGVLQAEGLGLQPVVGLDGRQLTLDHDRGGELHLVEHLLPGVEQVAAPPEAHLEAHHEALAQRVDGRVGDLREPLLEVVVQHVGAVREHRQGDVVAHAVRGLPALGRHGLDDQLRVLQAVPEGRLQLQGLLGLHRAL